MTFAPEVLSAPLDEQPPAIRAAGSDPVEPLTRLRLLADPGSLRETSGGVTAGVLSADATIDGVNAVVFATDPQRLGASLSAEAARVIVEAIDRAVHCGFPVIGVWQCGDGSAGLRDGVAALDGIGQVVSASARASGTVPQVSVVLGEVVGSAAHLLALNDVMVMGPAGRAFLAGPEAVRSVTGEEVDPPALGGPEPHSRRSGLAHLTARSERAALTQAREVTALLARPGRVSPQAIVAGADPGALLPDRANRAYDVRPLVRAILDGRGVELHPRWAPNVVTTLGRLGGGTVGVVANNPIRRGGCLDARSAEKAARFVRMCDVHGVPLVVVVDVPGYLPGLSQEWDGVVRRGAKLLHAFAEAVVPRVTLLTGKAYGGAYIAMNSRALGATAVLAWPTAEVAVMGPEAAVRILHRRQLAACADEERDALRERLVERQRHTADLQHAIDAGVVDAVIEPATTRRRLAEALRTVPARGHHTNIPL